MRLYFRPFLGLTIFTLISIAILLGLGTWQYQRLQWKTALLEEVEAAVTAPPFTSLAAVSRALDEGRPADFSRIEFSAAILPGQIPYLVYSRSKRELSWRNFVAAQEGASRVYLAAGLTPDCSRQSAVPTPRAAAQPFAGYVRTARARERGSAKSTPAENRWFSFNPLPDTCLLYTSPSPRD